MVSERGPRSGVDDAAVRRAFNAMRAVQEVEVADVRDRIPVGLRADRLSDQIALFEHAGYRLESRTQVQAVVARSRRGVLRRLLGSGGDAHRVTITIDRDGAVRLD